MRPPSVDALARSLVDTGLPHPLLVDVARAAIAAGDPESARSRADELQRALLRPLINATGVLLHTNLGRAPLGHRQPPGYWNLELDLDTGLRGSRHDHVGRLLARLCGAEAAIVVNNNAAAVLLVIATLAAGRDVVVSRGESVEIGGGFRVPEVLQQSGARLVDVGTTNRTRLSDYEVALRSPGADVALGAEGPPLELPRRGLHGGRADEAALRARRPGRPRHRLGAARCRVPVAAGRAPGLVGAASRPPARPCTTARRS